MTQYVMLSPDTTRVVSVFHGPQPNEAGFHGSDPNYAQIPDSDARYIAFLSLQSAFQEYADLSKAGIAITSTGASSLNGTYGCDSVAQQRITSEAVYIQATGGPGTGKFTNGQATKAWPDITGAPHTFDTAQFIAFAEAMAERIDALETALGVSQAGGAWAPPAMSATIA